VLIAEHVTDGAFVKWHTLFLCEVHSLFLMNIAVLESKVLRLVDFGELFEEFIVTDYVQHLYGGCLSACQFISLHVLHIMDKGALLILCQTANRDHKLLEPFLLLLVALVIRLSAEIESTNVLFECLRFRVYTLQQFRVQVFLVVKFCNLRFRVMI